MCWGPAISGRMSLMEFILRPAGGDDELFLAELYIDVHRGEFAPLSLPQDALAGLLQMQFRAQRGGYQASYPKAQDRIVWIGAERAGRVLVDYGAAAAMLVDIALISGFRCKGMGTAILRSLQAEAQRAGLPLRLSVRLNNPAFFWYQRLGFRQTGQSATHYEMEFSPELTAG